MKLNIITGAGVVPCSGPKRSLRLSPIVQIMFSIRSFEIGENILRNQSYEICIPARESNHIHHRDSFTIFSQIS